MSKIAEHINNETKFALKLSISSLNAIKNQLNQRLQRYQYNYENSFLILHIDFLLNITK